MPLAPTANGSTIAQGLTMSPASNGSVDHFSTVLPSGEILKTMPVESATNQVPVSSAKSPFGNGIIGSFAKSVAAPPSGETW